MPLVDRPDAHAIDVIAELFVVADPGAVRAAACDAARWAAWFPGSTFTSYDDRGDRGDRWRVTGRLTGTAEVWLEEHGDGTIVHAYLRVDETPPAVRSWRRRHGAARVDREYGEPLLHRLFGLKDALEGQRAAGDVRVPVGERVVSASEHAAATQKGVRPDGGSDDVQHHDRR